MEMQFKNVMANDETVRFLKTISGSSNEGVFNAIFKSHNTNNIVLAKKLLSKDRMDDIVSMSIEKVLATTSGVPYSPTAPITQTANYLPASSSKLFMQYKQTLKELLPPSKFKEVSDFISMASQQYRVEALAKNTSMTGQTLIVYSTIRGVLANPLSAVSTLGVPWVAAKMYTHPAARQYFMGAMRLPPESKKAIEYFAKAWNIAAMQGTGGLSSIDKKESPSQATQPQVQKGYVFNPETGDLVEQ
jgi:hypothetical protein